jgi:acyl carrier protein
MNQSPGGYTEMASIQEQVYEIIQRKLSVNAEQITPEASFTEDLGADSLDTVELVMDLEEQFNITIPEEDQEKLRTVQDAIDYLESHLE